MSKIDKLKIRLSSRPKDFTYDEAKMLLQSFGFEESNKGKTSGSRICFFRPRDKRSIMLHKPHPQNGLKDYVIRDLINFLKDIGEL